MLIWRRTDYPHPLHASDARTRRQLGSLNSNGRTSHPQRYIRRACGYRSPVRIFSPIGAKNRTGNSFREHLIMLNVLSGGRGG
jgi:hypothetical protein